MERLVFIDDDPAELESMREIAKAQYEYVPIRWPPQQPLEQTVGEPPAIFVLDLYLPPAKNSALEEVPEHELTIQQESARNVADCFSNLYADLHDDPKRRLRRTMECLTRARELLDRQWRAMGQSPENGTRLLEFLRAHPRYGGVPVVFYSRKITPEDVVRVLKAGAVDAIRKGFTKEQLLQRLTRAQEIYRSERAEGARKLGLNVNAALAPE
jgi:CheY-like chemotaxis protein